MDIIKTKQNQFFQELFIKIHTMALLLCVQ